MEFVFGLLAGLMLGLGVLPWANRLRARKYLYRGQWEIRDLGFCGETPREGRPSRVMYGLREFEMVGPEWWSKSRTPSRWLVPTPIASWLQERERAPDAERQI